MEQIAEDYLKIARNAFFIGRNTDFYVSLEGALKLKEISYIQAEGFAGGIGRDASTLINKIKAAQYVRNHPGEVCPAKWQEGSETLKPSLDLVGKI